MSRYFAGSRKASSVPFRPNSAFESVREGLALAVEAPGEPNRPSRGYLGLIRLLFQNRAAVAVIGSSALSNEDRAHGASNVAEGLAEELAANGNRVVVVSVTKLLATDLTRISEEMKFTKGGAPHVWHWPASVAATSELIQFGESSSQSPRPSGGGPGHWLDFLRGNFGAVLLDCPYVEGSPGVIEVAAMADAVVLVVQTGHTSKAQVQHNLQALQLWGARVVGTILIERS
jgi:hypothetical protein